MIIPNKYYRTKEDLQLVEATGVEPQFGWQLHADFPVHMYIGTPNPYSVHCTVCMYVCVCMCVCIYMCVCVCVCIYLSI